MPISPSKKN